MDKKEVIQIGKDHLETILRVWTNLKNWKSWDAYDFKLTEEEGKNVEIALKLYLDAFHAIAEKQEAGWAVETLKGGILNANRSDKEGDIQEIS